MTAARALVISLAVVSVALPATQATAAEGEASPEFKASSILPIDVLSSPIYRVDERVRNNGYLNVFSVTVHDRTFEVVSNALMRERLRELGALEQMEEVDIAEVYGESLKKGVTAPVRLAEGLVTEPGDTVSDVASGIGTFAENIGHSLFGGASEQESGVVGTALGADVAKRNFAHEFGIDPYTNFAPTRDRLNELSTAAVAGGVTVSVGFQFTPKPANTILGVTKMSQGMRQLVRDKTPAQLKEINDGKLAALGVSGNSRELFLEHRKFSPTQKTLLVEALSLMGLDTAEVFIKRSILVNTEDEAFLMRRWAEAMSGYHRNVKPLARLVSIGRGVFSQRADGVLVGTFPIDHLAWTSDLAQRHATNMQSLSSIENVTGGEIWLEGTISPKARAALEAENWVIQEGTGEKLGL